MSLGKQTPTGLYFQRLDPIIQILLDIVNKYQECMKHGVSKSAINSENVSNNGNEEYRLGLIRTQSKMLQQLQKCIENFNDSKTNGKQTTNKDRGDNSESEFESTNLPQHLSILSEYISLPLNAILHITSKEAMASVVSSNSYPVENNRILQIRLSAVRQLQQETARTISLFSMKCISPAETNIEPNHDNKLFTSSTWSTTCLPNAHVVRFLVALAAVLPLGASPIGDTGKEDRTLEFPSSSASSLDKGIDSQIEVLKTISSLVSFARLSKQNLATSITSALDGALLARISDACCSMLLQVTASATTGSSSSSNLGSRVKPQSARLALQALNTLETMFTALSQNVPTWQNLFPGMFSALHRFFVRLRRVPISLGLATEMQCHGLKTLAQFLRLTLDRADQGAGEVADTASSKSVINQLQAMAIRQKQESHPFLDKTTTPPVGNATETESKEFFEQVNARLVAPLTVLLQTIMMNSSSTPLKLQAVSFFRAVLLDTRGCWNKNIANDLLNLVLESCLILQQDENESVKSAAAQLLQDYGEKGYLGADMSTWIVPRITESIEELPALAQRKDSVDLRAKIKVINGYFYLVDFSKDAQSSLVAVRDILLKALRPLFDIDFVRLPSGSPVSLSRTLPIPPFLHLSKDVALLAKGMVQTLGKAFGTKHGALAVDSCVADFYEAYVLRFNPCVPVATAATAYADWLHSWIGYLALASEILVGAFERSSTLSVESNDMSKSERRRRRALVSLSQSLLPILTSSHFWDLETSLDFRTDHSSETMKKGSIATTVLRGNATLVCLLLQMIDKFVGLLQQDCEAFLPLILYPVVEKAGSRCAPLIQTAAARAVLKDIAEACGDGDTPRFLQNHMDHLASSMLGRLRISGGKVVPDSRDSMEILAVCNSVRYLLQTLAQRAVPGGSNESLETYSVSNMVEIVSMLAERFNHLILRKAIGYEALLDFVLVCSSTFSYMLAGYGADREFLYSYRRGNSASLLLHVWQGGLDQFRIETPDVTKESFSLSNRNEEPKGENVYDKSTSKSLGVTSREIEFVSQLMSRCCYFLSHESLKMRIASTDALIGGFKFLAFVAWNEEEEDASNEANPVKTSILRQVAGSWQAVNARLATTSDELIGSQRVQSIVVFHSSKATPESSLQQEASTKRIFLAKLVTLVAAMAEGSGEFMADRFKNEVWPVLVKQFEYLISKRCLGKDGKDGEKRIVQNIHERSSPWQETEKLLILALMDCVKRTFGRTDCGLALSVLVPTVGTVALSFLDDAEESVSIAAFEALKKLMEIDNDALWRPLLELSGQGIPIHPLKPSSAEDDRSIAVLPTHSLATKARKLLAYAESLPEQAIW